MTEPGSPEPEDRVFVRTGSGEPGLTGVVSVATLFAGFLSSFAVTVAVLVRRDVDTGVLTRTAKIGETEAPIGRVPWRRVQVEPAAGPGVQDHPGELEAASKVVLAGTVSKRVTACAEREPMFWRLRT